MENRRKFSADKESILMALDQLRQTMDVMGQVVARLKRSVEQSQAADYSLPETRSESHGQKNYRLTQSRPAAKPTSSSSNHSPNEELPPEHPIVLH